ncbi:MAG: glycosyltransferase family 4 protein [Armatimonadota bacterium]|nr:glycosyltransferase family 4 protein [Armatimonadota bacterium]MDR7440207.1 glycosyltransferase family 4 protein [Armatimonadota bacterium]MDR7563904.1 glycosyltransferase family 4 protein [Armatimonadota bacterium]MDR7567656.1 glycosyltransferase family 4 protein [Armatimonadota bacterium]MDR7600926.1 glycosyltransferase family 4 protein [Armatimonadota bacterium]
MRNARENQGCLSIALLSTYPPRECGIATFSRDLAQGLREWGVRPLVVAMNDENGVYRYGPEVVGEIRENCREDYRSAALRLNQERVDVVNVQHEFGIFGGDWGEELMELLDHLERPVVTTLHTVLSNPPAKPRQIIRTLCRRSAAVVVLSPSAVDLLEERYGVPRSRVRMIWHGVPVVERVPRAEAKARLGLEDRWVLTTFGLVSPGKGIEDVLDALPSVARVFPNVLYLVLGETHPNLRRREGEWYRNMLMERVQRLGIQDLVRFENRYMEDGELIGYLQATDIYLTPYLNPDQIVSGTLSWALACGCAVVSTPYRYAQDVLSNGRGVLVPFRSPAAVAAAVIDLLSDPVRRERMGERTWRFAQQMHWPAVTQAYVTLFREVARQVQVDAAV